MLKDGNLQRFEAGKRDPALVAFGRYGFDMSKFSSQGHDVTLGIRERYLWELFSPSEDDPVYKQIPASSARLCTTACWRRSIPSPLPC